MCCRFPWKVDPTSILVIKAAFSDAADQTLLAAAAGHDEQQRLLPGSGAMCDEQGGTVCTLGCLTNSPRNGSDPSNTLQPEA